MTHPEGLVGNEIRRAPCSWMYGSLGLLAASGVVGACASSGEASPAAAVRDSAGVTIVESHGPRWRVGEAWSVSPRPRVTIGVVSGDDVYQLFRVTSATRLSDGSVVVVDGGSRTIRRYDASGAFVWAAGGRGSGPGEFQDPDQVLVTTSDSLVIWDNALYRVTKLAATGALVGSETVDRGAIAKALEPPLYPGRAHLLPGGGLLVRLVEKTKDLPSGRFRRPSGALLVSPDRTAIDTLMHFGDVEQTTVDAPWGPISLEPAFAKRTSIAVHPTSARACIGEQETHEIMCFGAERGSRVALRWTADSTTVTADELAAWRETAAEALALKVTRADAVRLVNQIDAPSTHPVYSQLVLDRVGNLWVERGPMARFGSAAVEFLVFDPHAGLLGSVALPPIRVLEIGEDYVMGVYRDAFEVEYVHIYGMIKPSVRRGGKSP